MAYLQKPIKIFENFLRSKLSELTRVGLSNRQTTDSESFNGDDSTTEFTLTLQPIAINSITIGGTEVYPFTQFNIDLDNKKIKFRTAPATGTNNIVINFEKGSNWIYAGKPSVGLSKTEFPRITIQQFKTGSTFVGTGSTNTYDVYTMQFDVLTYRKQLITIGTETKEGPDVTEYLAEEISKAIKTYWDPYLVYRIILFTPVSDDPAPFEPAPNIHRRIVQVSCEFRQNEEVI